MNTRVLALAAVVACLAGTASAVTFTAGLPISAPKLGATSYTATQVGSSYKVNLPGTVSFTGLKAFSWDFYAQATPGFNLASATITFTLDTNGNSKWKDATGAKYVVGATETAIPSVGSPTLVPFGPGTLTQTINLTSPAHSKWHISASDLFLVTGGSIYISDITATVKESPVPEPATMVVLTVGALGLIRRRKSN